VQTAPSRDHDDSHDWEAGGSGTRCMPIATHNDKHSVRPPMNHFKRLLEEACPNHTYPIKHKLKDCGMMRSFMTLRSLTWCAKLDQRKTPS
jgi:hypothetical protein